MLPKVWALMSYREGENAQIMALVDALAWPYDQKRLCYKPAKPFYNLFRKIGLNAICKQRSSAIKPPWPNLLISAGMKNEPVARWIKQQSRGHTQLVHIGRPWASINCFDLVVTTPQYRLPEHPNVLHNHTTLNFVHQQLHHTIMRNHTIQLGDLPRPHIAVVVGGSSGPYTLGPKATRRLGCMASELAKEKSGSLLVTTSARTTHAAASALEKNLSVANLFYCWRPNRDTNPYFAFLQQADEIIVTADSISMLSEACATRKPVHMFDLGVGRHSMQGEAKNFKKNTWLYQLAGNDFELRAFLYRQLMRLGPSRLSRDIRLVHRWLVDTGRVVWLGQAFPQSQPLPVDDLQRTIDRVRLLVLP